MYRLILDVPYRFIVRPTYERAVHMIDARYTEQHNIYHDTGAGVAILTPSCIDHRLGGVIIPVSDINRQSEVWAEVKRQRYGENLLPALSLVRPANTSVTELLVQVALYDVATSIGVQRYLQWLLETSISLDRDEAFALHIQCSDDEYRRDPDFVFVQWDRYGLHMDTRGVLRLCRYPNRANLQQPPNVVATWHSGLHAPHRSALTLAVLPLPPLGLMVMVLASGGTVPSSYSVSSTTRQLISAKLIPLADDATNIGTPSAPLYSLCEPSALRVAINRLYTPVLAIERVRYATQGSAIEEPFALPLINPQVPTATPIIGYTHQTGATVQPLLADKSNWNTAQAPEQARTKLTLTTTDTRYTPIVIGYYLRCEPLIAQRDTTPRIVNLKSLELTVDEYAQDEGQCEVLTDDPQTREILLRGDTTYRLECSSNGTTWHPLSAGFARVERVEVVKQSHPQPLWRAQVALRGMWSRFGEIYQLSETAFDGVPLGTAFNKLLEGCGFEPIPTASLPAALQAIRIPTIERGENSSGWRYAPRVGQSGTEILKTLLLLATASGQEWRLRFDANTGNWVLEPKPNNPSLAWIFAPTGSHNPTGRQVRYQSLVLEPRPPEANIVYVEGATAPSKDAERVVVVLVNEDSLEQPASRDYLGRTVLIRLQAEGISDVNLLTNFAERVYNAACRHEERYQVQIPLSRYPIADYLALLRPPVAAILPQYGGNTLYVKQATLQVQSEPAQTANLTLYLSSRFEGDPREY